MRISLFHLNDDEMEMTKEDYKLAAAAPTWLSQLIQEREQMVETLKTIANMEPHPRMARAKARHMLKQVGELDD